MKMSVTCPPKKPRPSPPKTCSPSSPPSPAARRPPSHSSVILNEALFSGVKDLLLDSPSTAGNRVLWINNCPALPEKLASPRQRPLIQLYPLRMLDQPAQRRIDENLGQHSRHFQQHPKHH